MTDKKKPGDTSQGGNRQLHVNVKTARGRKTSSVRWLQRQLNDPYVHKARQEGYRSRAAYKMMEIDDKFSLFKPGQKVIDLGAAPGGWTQVAVERIKGGKVIGIDLQAMEPIPGAILICHDFMADDAPTLLAKALDGQKTDVVLSDMAAPSCGHAPTDHLRIVALCEVALDFALMYLAPGGAFVAKILRGGTEKTLLDSLKKHFTKVKHVKPDASRKDSSEMYVVATGFKGEQ